MNTGKDIRNNIISVLYHHSRNIVQVSAKNICVYCCGIGSIVMPEKAYEEIILAGNIDNYIDQFSYYLEFGEWLF